MKVLLLLFSIRNNTVYPSFYLLRPFVFNDKMKSAKGLREVSVKKNKTAIPLRWVLPSVFDLFVSEGNGG